MYKSELVLVSSCLRENGDSNLLEAGSFECLLMFAQDCTLDWRENSNWMTFVTLTIVFHLKAHFLALVLKIHILSAENFIRR